MRDYLLLSIDLSDYSYNKWRHCTLYKFYLYSDIFWKLHKLHLFLADKTFRVIIKLDLNTAEPTFYRTNFMYASSG